MRIQHNILSLNVHRNLTGTNGAIAKNLEKLSSGYKINRAGDDAAGLAISEKMRAQITGINQARQNADDGISLVQTVEGAMTEVHSMLNRMMELSVLSANGTYSKSERIMINQEMQQLKTEIDRIGKTSSFNGIKLFPENGLSSPQSEMTTYGITLDLTNRTCTLDYISGPASISTANMNRASSGYEALYNKISTEYFPNAISQIFDAFPSLEAAVGTDKIGMELHIGNIDGYGGTLAYAKFSFYPTGKPFKLTIKVDAGDFSNESINAGSPDVGILESTIAHELMHSVMQYTMTDAMSGRNGFSRLPEWFTEGTAQLSGGGFPTNWNYELEQIAKQLTSENDTSKDAEIGNYLKKYSVTGRPYGHGYLASAYIGYLASGKTSVTGQTIAEGMDKIFDDLINKNSGLFTAISAHTGISHLSSLEHLFNTADKDLVEFVRKLAFQSKNGAGSVITPSLSDGGSSIIGDTVTAEQAFHVVDKATIPPAPPGGFGGYGGFTNLQLMVGEDNNLYNIIDVELFQMSPSSLGLADTNALTHDDALDALINVRSAIDKVSSIRSYYGALQNRLEHTVSYLDNMGENLTASESRIRDTDMAKSMMEYVRNQILLQSGQAMLAQANQQPSSILQLLNA
ncbi:MAG: flagellinolysin [Dorea sp.]|nr:flagellinolysin [Dorea sp.]